MAVRLQKLLEKVTDQEITVLAGREGLKNPIRWMHMVEGVEISTFLEGGEMAFVTGIALAGEEELTELVRSIQRHGAGGVMINLGPYIRTVPQELIAFCDGAGFPLLTVPWHIHMAVIIKRFSEEIVLSGQAQTEWSVALQNALRFPEQTGLYLPVFESRGLREEWSYRVCLLEPEDPSRLDGALRAVENCLTELDGPVHYAVVGGQIALLAADLPLERTTALLTQLLAFCRREMPDCPLYCGAGRATQSIRCVHKTYLLAQRVLKLQRKRGTAWTSAAYEDLNVYRLLMAVEDGELLREYVTAALGPLLACDETGGSGHIAFLTAWMECNGSIQRTAERLFLHRNTVEYHLKRIGTLLGRDLGDLDTRMELWLALKLLNLQ